MLNEKTVAWRQFYDDTLYWEVNTGGTPTAAAGPDGASDGDYYLFNEGHDKSTGGSSNNSNYVEAIFDFSPAAAVSMRFDYHMYGTYINYLTLDVYDGSSWTNDVWRMNGQQHTSSSDPWSTANVDLSAFAGQPAVTLRFRTEYGVWNAADPAIDNIFVWEPGAVGYPTWVLDHGLTGGDADFLADPEGDGIPNGAEYILGRDPAVRDNTLQAFTFGASDLIINFDRNENSTGDTNQFFQYSYDLLNWTDLNLTGTIPPEVSIGAPVGGLEPITITIDNTAPAYDKIFWRFRIELQ